MLEEAKGIWTYYTVFGVLIAAGFGMPIPEEVPVVLGGSLAGHASAQDPREHPYWWILWPLCIVGAVTADGCLYGIGRLGGRRLLESRWIQKRFVKPEKQKEIEDNFHKYGIKILLGARFLPGFRAPIFIMAGVLKMPVARFLIADGIYAIPGVSVLFFLAFWFTDSFVVLFNKFKDRVDGLRPLIILVVIAAAGGYFFYAYWRRSVVTGDPHEVPIIGGKVKPSDVDAVTGEPTHHEPKPDDPPHFAG